MAEPTRTGRTRPRQGAMEIESVVPTAPATLAGDSLLLSLLGITDRAPAYALDYLTVKDLLQLPLVSKTVRRNLREIEYHRCKDGGIYKVPFPGFPGLLEGNQKTLPQKNDSNNNLDGLFPHQLASLQAMHLAENAQTTYGALRGGILADAPGLGKTISCLGLITSTAGKRPAVPKEFWDSEKIEEGWQALTQNPGAWEDISKAIAPFRPCDIFPTLEAHVRPPFPVDRFPCFKDFELYVKRTVKDSATESEKEKFRMNLLTLKKGLHKSHRKILMSELGRRISWERSLIPSSATLIVVPDALLEHWFHQTLLHLNRHLFADEKECAGNIAKDLHSDIGDDDSTGDEDANHNEKSLQNTCNREGRGVVYLDGFGDIADAGSQLGAVNNSKTYFGGPLPYPMELSKYMIVVTTFSRIEREFQNEVQAGRMVDTATAKNGKRKHDDDGGSRGFGSASSLLQLRWLRLVVDEGHELGTHEGGNGLTQFIHQMAAERRWVLSGTPTTGDEDDLTFTNKALDQLQRLLLFLRHPVYGSLPSSSTTSLTAPSPYVYNYNQNLSRARKPSRNEQKEKAKETWITNVKEPFLQKKPEGRAELLKVLRGVMVMHRKEDIHLPKPQFVQSEVGIDIPEEIQANIRQYPGSSATLLDEYIRTDEFQTIVDKAQGEHILRSIQQAKAALQERGGPLKNSDQGCMKMLSDSPSETIFRKDRRPIKSVVYSANKFNLRDVTEALYTKLDPENIAEAYDDSGSDCNPELSRFRLNQKEIRRCPLCSFQNDVVSFEQNRRGATKCENILLEVVSTEDENLRFLVERERIERALPVDQGGNVVSDRFLGGLTQYGAAGPKAWRVDDILEVDIRDPHPLLPKRQDQATWDKYGADKCIKLAKKDRYEGFDWYYGPLPSIDSNDDYRLMEVKLAKWQPCGRFHNRSRWFQGPKLSQSPLETIREDVFVLSLDAGLAHGLDLSFVTNIFLLEPINDAALLEQITSRAHRLGATGPVTIDTVNTHYEIAPDTKAAVERCLLLQRNLNKDAKEKNIGRSPNQTGPGMPKSEPSLNTVVCQYCYRQFDSVATAESHESTICPRNPANVNVVDPWHLSSVYREIKPPPPRSGEEMASH